MSIDRKSRIAPPKKRKPRRNLICNDPARWVIQDRLVNVAADISGNCTEAALASLFGVSLQNIGCMRDGDLSLNETPEKVARYWDNVESVFNRLGYEMLCMDGAYAPDCIYMADGMTERGFAHFALYRSGQLLHDPYPDGKGLLKVERVYLPIPRDPAGCVCFGSYNVGRRT